MVNKNVVNKKTFNVCVHHKVTATLTSTGRYECACMRMHTCVCVCACVGGLQVGGIQACLVDGFYYR